MAEPENVYSLLSCCQGRLVICPPEVVNLLITDDGISKEALEAFTRIGTRVLVA